jgi:hypothetical protein
MLRTVLGSVHERSPWISLTQACHNNLCRLEGSPQQKPTFRRPLSDLKETAGPPLLLAFVDFLCEFAKLLGLFVARAYL